MKHVLLTALFLNKVFFSKNRHERFLSIQSRLTLISITLAVAVLVCVMAVMEGFQAELEKRFIGLGAPIQIEKFRPETDQKKTLDILKTLDTVSHVSPYLLGSGLFYYGSNMHLFNVMGITDAEWDTTYLKSYIVKGTHTISDNQILVGEDLAALFDLSTGDSMTLVSPNTQKPSTFKIVGIFKTNIYIYDNTLIYTPLSSSQNFFNLKDTLTGYKVLHRGALETSKIQIQDALGPAYEVQTWLDINRSFIGALHIEKN